MSASPGPAVAPGPKSFFGLRTFPGFQRGAARIDRHVADANRYGDVVRYDIGRIVAHILRHPDDIKHVLQENPANYIKGRGLRKLKIFLGEGLLTSEGAHWLRQRRLIQPAFHRARLQALVGKMARATQQLDRFAAHQRFSLAQVMGGNETAIDGSADDVADHFDHLRFIVDNQNAGLGLNRRALMLD